MRDQPTVPVDAAEIGIVQHVLRLSGRIGRIVAVIRPDGNHIIAIPIQYIRHIGYDRQVTAEMLRQQFAVHEHLTFAHNGLEMQKKFLPFQSGIGRKMLAIPDLPLVIDTTTRLGRQIFDTVRQGDNRPVFIIKFFCFRTFHRTFMEAPGRIHRIDFPPAIIEAEKAGCRKLRLPGCPQGQAKPDKQDTECNFLHDMNIYNFSLSDILI